MFSYLKGIRELSLSVHNNRSADLILLRQKASPYDIWSNLRIEVFPVQDTNNSSIANRRTNTMFRTHEVA